MPTSSARETMAVIRSVLIWTAIVLLTIAFFCVLLPAAVLTFPFDRKKNTPHWFAKHWARSLLRVNPGCRVTVEGEEHLANIGGNGASVICANHESMADIVALYYLGYPFKWISKVEVFYVPLVGWAMWMAGYIPLRRGQKDSILKCMSLAGDWLRRGVSVTMFPEGTRSYDGRVKGFKDGAFRLAVDTGVPIIPVALDGPRNLVMKGSWKFASRARMTVRVGPPIRPLSSSPEEVTRLKEATRQWILENMAQLKNVPVAALDASAPAPQPPPIPIGNTAPSRGF